MAGPSAALPRARDGEEGEPAEVEAGSRKRRRGAAQHAEGSGAGGGKRQPGQKGKAWVLKKKEQMRGKGVPVPDDSKYTARKRRPTF